MKSDRIDAIDRKILAILQEEGRLANARLAERVGLSPPSVLERVRKLEQRGIISGYSAQVDAPRLGLKSMVFVQVSLSFHQAYAIEKFRKAILATPGVLECYHVTGEDDFLLKVVVPEVADYEDFLLHTLTQIEGVSKVKSAIVLSTLKHSSRLPLPEGE